MRRVANGSQAASQPAVASPSGTPGYFTDGTLTSGIQGTILDNDWCNGVQEGLIADGQFVTLLATASVTVPAWATRARAWMWGAGGGGGGSTGSASAGSGGGGGGYQEILVSGLVAAASIYGVVGAAGSPQSAGGATSFGSYATCNGGSPGSIGSAAINLSPGMGGAVSATGAQVIDSAAGASGGQGYTAGTTIVGAPGGSSFGSGPAGVPTSTGTTAQNGFGGSFAGQGAAGGICGGSGGTGAGGKIIIEWLP